MSNPQLGDLAGPTGQWVLVAIHAPVRIVDGTQTAIDSILFLENRLRVGECFAWRKHHSIARAL